MMKGQENPATGENQRVDMSVAEEIGFGREAVPQMGYESRNFQATERVNRVGQDLVFALDRYLKSQDRTRPYPFEFHLLDNSGQNQGSVNAFALPGGQVFITESLYRRLSERNDGELAGVLGHEIGHVLERHGSQRMAHSGLMRGITSAAGVAGGSMTSSQIAASVGNLVSMQYSQGDELESDRWGVRLMISAGHDPRHLLTVMDVLEEAGGGGSGPQFMSTHPRPADRKTYIKEIIDEDFPQGLPPQLR